ncbi:MAG: ABC transporter permease [Gammaproteobacteria bacterium]|nr:ABC transporter permease [Gammaproteobacteria bacterium]
MLNINAILSVARAEMQQVRRMVRTWVFIVLALLISIGQYLGTSVNFMATSTTNPIAGLNNPRYILAAMGTLFIGLFSLGIIFLSFDIRTRDVKNRIYEVLDSRPITNIELIVGRLAGVIWLFSIPMLIFLFLVVLYSGVSQIAGFGFGEPIEIWSVLSFVVFDVLPNLAIWGALVILLAVLVRWRFLVVILSVGLMFGLQWLASRLPLDLQLALTPSSAIVFPSDLVPFFVNSSMFFNRVALLLIASGFLFVASALYVRREATQARDAVIGVSSVALGVVMLVSLCNFAGQDEKLESEWARSHSLESLTNLPDIQTITGNVDVFPGNKIRLELQLQVLPISDHSNAYEVFSLNPGYKIETLEVNGTTLSDYRFEAGLLKIPKQYFSNAGTELKINAQGKVDLRFAYLDSVLRIDRNYFNAINFIRALGDEYSIFHPNFIALLPGIKWLPTAGPAVSEDQFDVRARDYFNIDLQVTLPKNWIAAGPGHREKLSTKKRAVYRFKPSSPVPAVALIASNFEQAKMEINGIEFEFLYSKKHRRMIRSLATLEPKLREWGEERLKLAESMGLKFPFELFSFVEVPSRLRVYGGGWRMESVLSQPGMALIRETTLPTARFDNTINYWREREAADEELAEQVFISLKNYYQRAVFGGNVLNALAQQFLRCQTNPHELGAIPLDFLLQELVADVIVDDRDYFSVPTITRNLSLLQGFTDISLLRGRTTSFKTWESIENTPLLELDYRSDPQHAYHILIAKSTAVITALQEVVGEDQLIQLLADLIDKFQGTNFSYDELRSLASQRGWEIDGVIGDWLTKTALPGFFVSDPSTTRLENDEDMNSVYETKFKIWNGESVPGAIRVWAGFNTSDNVLERRPVLGPIRVRGNDAFQIAIHTESPPNIIEINPYLSYNRRTISLTIPKLEDYTIAEIPPQPQVLPIDWTPFPQNTIIVDDLDAGFSVEQMPRSESEPVEPGFVRFLMNLAGELELNEADYGLPISPNGRQNVWYRDSNDKHFGRYRRTAVQYTGSGEKTPARFETTIERSGTWRLDYYLGSGEIESSRFYSVSFSLTVGTATTSTRSIDSNHIQHERMDKLLFNIENDTRTIETDLEVGRVEQFGWVPIGEFKLVSGPVVLTVTSEGNVIADAIRWTYLSETE